MNDDFFIDAESQERARSITEELSKTLYDRKGIRFEWFAAEQRAGRRIESPLDRLGGEGIPVRDISNDVSDFGTMLEISRYSEYPLPVIYMGENAVPVPLLPTHGLLMSVIRAAGSPDPGYLWVEFLQSFLRFPPDIERQERGDTVVSGRVGQVEWQTAHQSFFKGLSQYLAARIAGVTWARRSQNSGSYGGGPPAIPPGGSSSGQWWTALTQGTNLSLYYAGTHAVRHPPNYLSGTTAPPTPFPIFLPMGTCYLGADAGPHGSVVWDTAVITVPSQTPTFSTNKF
jgi:hypothetical protein